MGIIARLYDFVGGTKIKSAEIDAELDQLVTGHNAQDTDLTTHKTAADIDHPDGSVGTAKLADSAVSTAKLADTSVTTDKLNDLAVTNAKVASSIDAAKISSGTVSNAEYDALNGVTSGIQSQLDAKIPLTQKGVADGVVPLNSSNKIDTIYIPDSVLGQLEYQGTWNAATNTPTLPDPSTVKGHYYVVATGGTYLTIDYVLGDWIVSNGTIWQKVDNTDAVPTVFGRTGNVVASTNDYTWAQINKAVSSLADLATRSAADLNSGILPDARMPNLIGDVTTPEGGVVTTIANQAVTTAKIADQNVTTLKIADANVTTPKIADNAVTAAKIPDGVLTAAKFIPGALTNETENGLRLDAVENPSAPNTAALTHGLQAVTVSQASPARFNVLGCTRCNILGKDGNCESLTPFTVNGSGSVTLSTTQVKGGSNSFKNAPSGTAGYAYKDYTYPLDTSKQYILAAWVYIESYTSGLVQLSLRDVGTSTARYTASAATGTVGSWQLVYIKIPTSNTLVGTGFRLYAGTTTTSTFVSYTDSIRLYELSAADYTAIGTTYTTDAAIDAFIRYVDSVQHVVNPGIVVTGKNLLPDFTKWTLHANAVVTEPYKLTLNATAANQYTTLDIPALPNTTYIFNITKTGLAAVQTMATLGGSATTVVFATDTLPKSFTTSATTAFIRILLYSSSSGTYTFSNPQLELGSTATFFEPYRQTYAYADCTLASSVDRTVVDELYEDGNGAHWKLKRFETGVSLDEDFTWAFSTDFTGFKQVSHLLAQNGITNDPNTLNVVKRNGDMLVRKTPFDAADQCIIGTSGTTLYISVSDTDSGWGETFTPSAAEVKAYFLGYKMNNGTFGTNYNGTGTKTWIPWGDTDNTNAVTVVPTTASTAITSGTYDYYRLSYQLATSTVEPVTVEGSLALANGGNQVEVLEGVIDREPANPVFSASYNKYYINQKDGADAAVPTGGQLKNRTEKIIAIYKNDDIDTKWKIGTDTLAYGKQRLSIDKADFDITAVYTVTYEMLDKYLYTSNVVEADLEYGADVGSVVAQNVKDIADVKRDVSILEQQGATKQYVDDSIGAIPPVDAATASALGTVVVAAAPASGNPIASSVNAKVSDQLLTTTAETTIATFTSTAQGNFFIGISYRVVTGTTNVTVKVTYADETGAQTNTMLNVQSSVVGTYSLVPLFINAVSGTAIAVKVTASVANQVSASASIMGV